MNDKAKPAAIAVALVILAIVVYAAYYFSFRPKTPPPTAESIPAYARERAIKPGMEGTAPTSQPPAGSDSSAGYKPMYGEGYGNRPAQGGGMPGSMPR